MDGFIWYSITIHTFFIIYLAINRVGFPLSVYDKVINKLEKLKIDYEYKSVDVCKKFKKLNKYNYFFEKEKSKYSLNFRLNKTLLYIEKLEEKEIDEIISYIERKLNISE